MYTFLCNIKKKKKYVEVCLKKIINIEKIESFCYTIQGIFCFDHNSIKYTLSNESKILLNMLRSCAYG